MVHNLIAIKLANYSVYMVLQNYGRCAKYQVMTWSIWVVSCVSHVTTNVWARVSDIYSDPTRISSTPAHAFIVTLSLTLSHTQQQPIIGNNVTCTTVL